MPILELWRDWNQDLMIIPNGLGDIGDPSRNNISLSRKTLRNKKDDTFLVWHPSPNAENTNAGLAYAHVLQLRQNKELSPVKIYHPLPNIAHKHSRGQLVGNNNNNNGGVAWNGGNGGGRCSES
jgi:hypothetical protein